MKNLSLIKSELRKLSGVTDNLENIVCADILGREYKSDVDFLAAINKSISLGFTKTLHAECNPIYTTFFNKDIDINDKKLQDLLEPYSDRYLRLVGHTKYYKDGVCSGISAKDRHKKILTQSLNGKYFYNGVAIDPKLVYNELCEEHKKVTLDYRLIVGYLPKLNNLLGGTKAGENLLEYITKYQVFIPLMTNPESLKFKLWNIYLRRIIK